MEVITPPDQAATEFWDGTSWTEVNDLATARESGGLVDNQVIQKLCLQVDTQELLATTEEWTAPSVFQQENLGQVFYNSTANAFKVTKQSVPAGTWASGGSFKHR
jgi:hypothetical protein